MSLALFVVIGAGCDQDGRLPGGPDVGWDHYANVPGGTRYSPLADLDRSNVAGLRVAWVARAGDFPPEVFDPDGHRAGDRDETGRAVPARPGAPCGACHGSQMRFESTPIMRDGLLYVPTPLNRVLALHPGTGEMAWSFDPGINTSVRYTEDLVSRGVASWIDEEVLPTAACRHRIFFATVTALLFALDAENGAPCEDFGSQGMVRLEVVVPGTDGTGEPGHYSVTSPPAVVGDLVVVGSAVNSLRAQRVESGAISAYDARTGKLQWRTDPIPRSADHPAWSDWSPSAARETGGANAWSIMAVDEDRDMLFVSTASAAPDFYGGGRPGRNDMANSVIAIRGSTGEILWWYQVVHHDLWDYDLAAQPILVDLRVAGAEVPAVIIGTKTGMLFVLDRETGELLFEVEERPVPDSDVPGELAWPTQPFPVETPWLHGTVLTPDSAFGITDGERRHCRQLLASLRNEGIFTPPSAQGTLVWPGYWGGINWDGMAWDPERQLLIASVKRLGMGVRLVPREQFGLSSREAGTPGVQLAPQQGTPYGVARMPLLAPSGTPCTPPPWSTVSAVRLAEGEVAWARPLGTVPWLREHPESDSWGSILVGGPLITAGGLLFIAASQDNRIRALDLDSGEVLWEHALPAGGQAAPMTYRFDGRQYVVIAAGGRSGIGEPGDWIVAFALPQRRPGTGSHGRQRRASPAPASA